jgi:hypothetical protein
MSPKHKNKNSILRHSKQIDNADKFKEFELLKNRFKLHRQSLMKAALGSMAKADARDEHICSRTGSIEFKFGHCLCAFCSYNTNIESILIKTQELNHIEQDIKEIIDYLRDTRTKLEATELKSQIAQEWKLIALVLDRTFFIIFLIITIATLVVFSNVKRFKCDL